MDFRETKLKEALEQTAARFRTEFETETTSREQRKEDFFAGMGAMIRGDMEGADTSLTSFEDAVRTSRNDALETLQMTNQAGFINGILMFEGQPYTGPFDGVVYVGGIPQTGFVSICRCLYHDGKPFTGEWEETDFVDGNPASGQAWPKRIYQLDPTGKNSAVTA